MSEPVVKQPVVVDDLTRDFPPPMSPDDARKHLQRGVPSPALQKVAQEMAQKSRDGEKNVKDSIKRGEEAGSTVIDNEPQYEPLTQGAPERWIFNLVGGWIDQEGKLQNEVELRAMRGHEEDLLGNNSIPITSRLDAIVANCCVRFGSVTDRGIINQIIRDIPTGTRTHLLICLRIASFYKMEKDIYSMEVECPSRQCRQKSHHKINLSTLERYEPPNPGEKFHVLVLPESKDEIVWRGMTGRWDHAFDVLTRAMPHRILTYTILARIVRWNGEDVEVPPSLVLTGDGNKPHIQPRTEALISRIVNLEVVDREALRADFVRHEPGIDLDVEFKCPVCGLEFSGQMDVGQPGFFFPQVTLTRSKRTFST